MINFIAIILRITQDHYDLVPITKPHDIIMATNPPKGDGHPNGAVRNRSQVFNPINERFVKRDGDTGRFMDQKANGQPFKGVRKEK